MTPATDGLLVVFSHPLQGHEASYLDWYDNRHIPEMLGLSCVSSAQGFRTVRLDGLPEPPSPYAVAYSLATPPDAAHDQIRTAAAEGRLTYAPSLDRPRSLLCYLEPRTPLLTPSVPSRPLA